eukprot:CAMPEP_0204524900 /NCGR_PEP_ID=MMETSP0661-20131031/7621_1 /ASSEMBLY_ACC=CAM_ASM_000606 /TAXON_ID=109239 /ORGANISM="Alexandrium margalefi, Strain AMGDE01CS-322" /LENGTH=375 /DNA_ID=CAMNT_0051530675 /DNA_START=56 /DNA_END=1183 /DNA_ORIENTATION=+
MAPWQSIFAASAACLTSAVLANAEDVKFEVQPSRGCSSGPARQPAMQDGLVKHEVTVPDFEAVKRVFWVQPPAHPAAMAAGRAPAPLLLSYHGQTGEAQDFALSHNFSTLGAASGLISVFPQGMGDASGDDDQGTGWNCGSGGMDGNATCIPAGVGKSGGCYHSCRKLGKCGRCNWSTCYDDVLFARVILAKLSQELCIDLNRVYLHGESNGGMMMTHLVREMPEAFAGVSPWFGTPMLGFLLGPQMQMVTKQADFSKIALLTLHARSDVTIPPGGGVSEDGWIFEAESSVRRLWAAIHGCQQVHMHIPTKWDGGDLAFRCHEHTACRTGRRVIGCRYNGEHGDWPNSNHGDQITLWFLLQFSRGRRVGGEELVV